MKTEGKAHFWQGEWLSDQELELRLERLPEYIEYALAQKFDLESLLRACQKLSEELAKQDSQVYQSLELILKEGFSMEKAERENELSELAKFLRRKDLEEKLVCELGAIDAADFRRSDYRSANFESWAPLGFLVHIAPTNAYSAGAWSVLEGLLSGNVNFLKTGGSDELFAQLFLSYLVKFDESASLAPRIIVCRISSSRQELLNKILSQSDGVVVWGDEGAISGVKAIAPASARFIEWGPKISFAYFASESVNDLEAQIGLAREICRMEQQACSSPQCVFVDTDKKDTLRNFAHDLAKQLAAESAKLPIKAPSLQEQAEITQVVEVCRLESCLGLTELIEAPDASWRILIDYDNIKLKAFQLKASPLYRTIWVKQLLRERIVQDLRPYRFFLQTCGLAAGLASVPDLTDALIRAGVLRITRCGYMLDSYSGEPHDGVYALQRYCRRVSLQGGSQLESISSLAEMRRAQTEAPQGPLMGKEDFQSMIVDPSYGQLFFKSGGSSGEPKLSVFDYDDYHRQMNAAAQGLIAAGLDPRSDRCMNLFFAGGLYGGFVSFFTILETLKAIQFPMAGIADTKFVAQTIVSQKVNVLLGMPSYFSQLFADNAELLAKEKVVEKLFFAGEHFSSAQMRFLKETFGISHIRSAGYGSVDAGPIGYQCVYCQGSEHHLHQGLQLMEILDMEKDCQAPAGEAGRVVLSGLSRHGQCIQRYEIGDLARSLPGDCPCGRGSPRFELLGRYGDVFRIGTAFFNYAKFSQILTETFEYAGEIQIILEGTGSKDVKDVKEVKEVEGVKGVKEVLRLLLDQDQIKPLTESLVSGTDSRKQNATGGGLSRQEAIKLSLLENYPDLRQIAAEEGLFDFEVELARNQDFQRAPGSGKLRHIIDNR